ncbi:MAG: hypothetical protein HYV26_02575 [Candidatus Hydrogenedentes bacterium]|nr:hypothetical protein [Candidatus Hydrogenedentota bacterium]
MLSSRWKEHSWFLAIMVVLCAAMMGEVLLIEMHHHDGQVRPSHCWACACGPLFALAVAIALIVPAVPAETPFAGQAPWHSICCTSLERLRGPPHFA